MAESCARFARSLPSVEHITAKIPWSTSPFPRRPVPGVEAFENTARLARYEMLFRCMRTAPSGAGGPANVIAFGHHGDDQVETALMRFGRGTTVLGGAGMRSCRRWGMGYQIPGDGEYTLGWSGLEGMDKWIVRPLLAVSKVPGRVFQSFLKALTHMFCQDRILATCEENSLEYVTDESNFQPHMTLRNAIRKVLTTGDNMTVCIIILSLPTILHIFSSRLDLHNDLCRLASRSNCQTSTLLYPL